MRTKASNAEVFDKFYKKIISGELIAPSYELVFTEKSTETKYEISGNGDDRDMVTLRKGSYSVTGKSTAAGDNIQDKCSLTISDEIVVDGSENVISLSAAYDCSLIIFTDTSVSSSNYNGEETNEPFQVRQLHIRFCVNIPVQKTPSPPRHILSGNVRTTAPSRFSPGR